MTECFGFGSVKFPPPLPARCLIRFRLKNPTLAYMLLLGLLGWSRSASAKELPPPHFDHERGLYFEPFTLALSCKARDARLCYTTDGSQPGISNGTFYTAPLRLTNTATVRVVALAEGKEASEVETRSYIFPREVARQTGSGFPMSWGTNLAQAVPASYAISPAVSSSPSRQAELAEALRALPTLSVVLSPSDLFGSERGLFSHSQESGEEWERAASLEFLPADGTAGFHLGCGVRMQGGWSRRPEESPKHSLRLVFRKRYGPGQLKQPIFGDGPAKFDTLILRGGNNNTWLHPSSVERRRADYLRDPWMRATYTAMGHPAARDRFVHLYLDGLYWGVYDLCERPDEHFAAAHLGGTEHDYDARNADKILSGDDLAWKRLFALANAGLESDASYAALGELLDVPAFIDYMVLNLYGANGDWDRGSNWYAVRRRNPSGRYLFLVWDGERTLEGIDDNHLNDDDDESPTRLFQKLRGNAEFRRTFSERARQHLTGSGVLAPAEAAARYRSLAEILDPAIPAEAARWGHYRRDVHPFKLGPYEIYTREEHWRPEVKRLLEEYFPHRARVVQKQFSAAGLLPP